MNVNVHGEKPPEPIHPDTLLQEKIKGESHRNTTIYSEGSDILHCNAINYNAALDQIVFSSPHISEIFIIDHSTTMAESADHKGGRYGRGGDFLYRWGNPHNYEKGDSTDQQLFGQHDIRWIGKGYPGEGNLSLYNNLVPGPDWYGIKTYFKRIATNAFAERVNLKIQEIKRIAKGYRNIHNFIIMIYFHLGG
ncbi:MAG: hypothetical protein ACI9FN_002861 [Saprospiraceae bacterium]|jgi:hypothetical protein